MSDLVPPSARKLQCNSQTRKLKLHEKHNVAKTETEKCEKLLEDAPGSSHTRREVADHYVEIRKATN